MIAVDNRIIEQIKDKNFANALVLEDAGFVTQQEEKEVIRIIQHMMVRTEQSFLNMELKDIEGILNITGSGLIVLAEVSGTNKAQKAIEQATIISEIQKAGIIKSSEALLGIIKGEEAEFEVEEFNTITNYLQTLLGEVAEILYGYEEDQQLADKIRVFVVIPFKAAVA